MLRSGWLACLLYGFDNSLEFLFKVWRSRCPESQSVRYLLKIPTKVYLTTNYLSKIEDSILYHPQTEQRDHTSMTG